MVVTRLIAAFLCSVSNVVTESTSFLTSISTGAAAGLRPSANVRTESRMERYPVQRHRFPSKHCSTSSFVGEFLPHNRLKKQLNRSDEMSA